jgi:hypothetical protein
MKNVKRLLFVIAGISLLIACTEHYPYWDNTLLDDTGPIMRTMPIKASFSGNYMEFVENINHCGASPMMQVLAEGSGKDVNLGDFTIYWDYCCDLEKCCFNTSRNIAATLVAATGDKLFILSWGTVCLRDENDPSDIVKKWDAPLLLRGGTGRYDGAYGEGTYIGYIYNHKDGEPKFGGTFNGTLTMINKD